MGRTGPRVLPEEFDGWPAVMHKNIQPAVMHKDFLPAVMHKDFLPAVLHKGFPPLGSQGGGVDGRDALSDVVQLGAGV